MIGLGDAGSLVRDGYGYRTVTRGNDHCDRSTLWRVADGVAEQINQDLHYSADLAFGGLGLIGTDQLDRHRPLVGAGLHELNRL